MVANVKTGDVDGSDYAETSVSSEYYSSSELTEMMAGFRKNGFFVTYYGGELDFIRADIEGQLERQGRWLQIVYNTAQSGIGAGRKALVPAYCARRGIHVCNSDAYVVSLVRHKFHVHCILQRAGLPTTDTWSFHPQFGWVGGAPKSGEKLIAKATFESSSIGLTPECVGVQSKEFEEVLKKKCSEYQQPFVAQRFISGFEVEVPLIELDRMRALDVVSITLGGTSNLLDQVLYYDIVDSQSYDFGHSDYLTTSQRSRIMSIAEEVATVLGIRGIGRVDFRIDTAGCPHVTDVSTSPHLVEHGSVSRAFEWTGLSHADMLAAMVGANAKRWGIA